MPRMKLSEKYLRSKAVTRRHSISSVGVPTLHVEHVKRYGEICNLEGKKAEAKKNLKGQAKVCRLREINKELKELAEIHGLTC